MSDITSIEWTDYTWNPWEGCTKVSPGCVNCYAAARNHRFGKDNWGKDKPRRRTVDWKKPLRWNRDAEKQQRNDIGPFRERRPRVFPSLCDWLDDEVPIEWLADVLKLIHDTPNLDWLLLTKRPENFKTRLAAVEQHFLESFPNQEEMRAMSIVWDCNGPPANVWIGTSIEDQKRADERIPELLKIPARVRFLSVEPLLGPVDLAYTCFNGVDSFGTMPGIHWVIVGGESGPGARPCNVEWIRGIVRQCRAAGVPCFVKQLGRWLIDDGKSTARDHGFGLERSWLMEDGSVFFPPILGENAFKQPEGAVGFSLSHPKGGDWLEWPDDLRVREFPRSVCSVSSVVNK